MITENYFLNINFIKHYIFIKKKRERNKEVFLIPNVRNYEKYLVWEKKKSSLLQKTENNFV